MCKPVLGGFRHTVTIVVEEEAVISRHLSQSAACLTQRILRGIQAEFVLSLEEYVRYLSFEQRASEEAYILLKFFILLLQCSTNDIHGLLLVHSQRVNPWEPYHR